MGVIEELGFAADSFDVVMSTLVMHHLPPDVRRRGLAEIRRVLRPGGRVLIVDLVALATTAHRLSPVMLLHHGLATTTNDLMALVTGSGFTGVEAAPLRSTGRFPLGYVRGWAP